MTAMPTAPRRPGPAARWASHAGRAPWGWALAGVLAGALPAVAVFAPARWLAAAVAQASGQQVLLAEPTGTLWSGSARPVLTGGPASQDRAALPSRLHWRLRPAWDGLRAELHAPCCTPTPLRLQLHAGLRSLRLDVADGQSQWPAAVLAGLGTPWNTLQPQGRLLLQTQGLQAQWAAGRLVLSGSAQLDALALSSRLSTLRPMGSYRITLQGGEAVALQLQTLQGALQLSGSGQWVGRRLRFTGEAVAAPGREGALSNLLNIIGRRNGARSLITLG